MAFYRICPDCGAYLDPGEQCSCHEERLIEMERKEKGVFEVTIQGDLDNQEYNYLIRHHKSFHETLDLYAYASNANSNSNIVIY